MEVLPRLDLTNDPKALTPGTPEWTSMSQTIKEALEIHGFFILVGNPVISMELHQRMITFMKCLFELPMETKRKNAATNPLYYSHVEPNVAVPLYETLAVLNAAGHDAAQSFTDLMWPEGNDGFCKTLMSMSKEMLVLAGLIMKMILESLGVASYWESLMGSSEDLFRIIRYTAPSSEDEALGLRLHTDLNYITLLSQNEVDGLQVKTRDGEWMQVKLEEGSIIVFAGQSLGALTNGKMHVPLHGVMVSREMDRFSYGMFLTPKGNHTLETLSEFIDEEHPAIFKPFTYIDFLKFAFRKNNDENILKMYAGV